MPKHETAAVEQPVEAPKSTEPSKETLARVAEEYRNKFQGKGLKRLANGGIEITVTLDVDIAASLIAWAEGAGEDPATFIPKQVQEALMAWTGNN